MNKKEEIKRLEEAVRLAEKGGNFDTIHHDKLAALTKVKPKAVVPPKEDDDGKSNR